MMNYIIHKGSVYSLDVKKTRILNIVNSMNKISFLNLKKMLKTSSGSLNYHLNLLEESKLIKIGYVKEDGKFKIGKEVIISI